MTSYTPRSSGASKRPEIVDCDPGKQDHELVVACLIGLCVLDRRYAGSHYHQTHVITLEGKRRKPGLPAPQHEGKMPVQEDPISKVGHHET